MQQCNKLIPVSEQSKRSTGRVQCFADVSKNTFIFVILYALLVVGGVASLRGVAPSTLNS